jgi:alkanesulfonate monooxygenase SsuD/methylene tetrahydromethanopterin reductase-like flavin-dependent oxidoreductase (luciferase family)
VQVGLSLPNRALLFGALTWDQMLAMAALAERHERVGSLWVGDSVIAKPRPEAVVLLAALAVRTTRLMLGPACMASFNIRNPIIFAAQWATLDVISHGRTVLAVCIGGPTGPGAGAGAYAIELQAMGFTFGERVGRMEEGIDIVRRLWTEDRVTHQGRFYQFSDVHIEPRPIQKPCPPVWIASSPNPALIGPQRFQKALERVARLADAWMTALLHPEEFGERWRVICDLAARAGRDPNVLKSAQHIMLNINANEHAARVEAKAFLDAYYDADFSDEELDRWGIFGSTQRCGGSLQRFVDAGCDVPIVRLVSWDPLRQLEVFLGDVLPQLTVRGTGRVRAP